MSTSSTLFSLSLLLSLATVAAAAETDSPDTRLLEKLYPAHPRLFIRKDDLPRLRQAVREDPLLQQWHQRLKASAQRMLSEKPIEHVLIGPRLLDKSRTALNRISTLAGLYLLDGDPRFAERARLEMLTAIRFPDWNPSHFLDTAEMCNAIGIGYDWLYDFLSPDDRKTLRTGLMTLGIQVGLDSFEKRAWWTRATHNWSQVCNGGLTVGALAIADEEPQAAAKLIALARTAIKPSMNAFAPDGGFAEGPGYWGYATEYNIFYLAALESALQTDFNLNAMPGFAQTGFYRIHSVSPIGRVFNYADAGDRAGTAPQMFYLSRIFHQPAFAAHELSLAGNRGSIFHLLWYAQLPPDSRKPGIDAHLPLDAFFRGVDVAFFRTKWNDPQALYVGIKGGDNKANHSHLDLGSFVLDALGQRWAVDLGGDDYNLPAYFGKNRWTYYRLRTESHNTLTLDGANQSPTGHARIIASTSTPDRSHVVIDLTNGYRTQAQKVLRGLAMLNRSQILIQDEVQAPEPVSVVWNFLTPAKIQIDGTTAHLTQGSSSLHLRILSPQTARFQIVSANPPPPQKQQPNIQNLTVQLPEKTAATRLVILITPSDQPPATPQITPLDQ
ncbi:MAG: heparinase II/III family protein, partial [Bacillota bacterium]